MHCLQKFRHYLGEVHFRLPLYFGFIVKEKTDNAFCDKKASAINPNLLQ
jgi:hypothetical protein